MVQPRGRDVLGDAHFQKQAQFLAIFRKITDAGRDGIARRADSRGLALYAHLAGLLAPPLRKWRVPVPSFRRPPVRQKRESHRTRRRS